MAKLMLGTREVTPSIYKDASSKYGATIDNMLGNVDANGSLQFPNVANEIIFSGVKEIRNSALKYKFYGSGITAVSFPDLEIFDGNMGYAFADCKNLETISFPKLQRFSNADGNMFNSCSNIVSVEFPELTKVGGYQAFDRAFRGCSKLKTVTFYKLEEITQGNTFEWAFSSCTALENVYFYGLKSIAQTSAFTGLLSQNSSGSVKNIHFPSNQQTLISRLSDYPLFGGTSGYVNLLFDLPATS